MIFYPKIMGTTTPQGGVFLIKIKDFNQKIVSECNESRHSDQEKSTLRRAFFNEINPLEICEMCFTSEIWLTPCKMRCSRVRNLFHSVFSAVILIICEPAGIFVV